LRPAPTQHAQIKRPQRARQLMGDVSPSTRKLSPYVSFEEATVPEEFFFTAVYRYGFQVRRGVRDVFHP
jgi:hypothetical protein